METISVIIPCYNSEKSIQDVVNNIKSVLLDVFDYQIILVNDYSKDNVWEIIKVLCEEDEKIVGLSLSQNFGQQAARMAALDAVSGDYIVFMDDDGQHDPQGIIKMIQKIKEGFDIVYAGFKQRRESVFRIWGSKVNRIMTELLIGKPKDVNTSSFFVTRRFVIEELKKYNTPFPYLFGYFMKITKNVACVELEHQERMYGKSGYTLKKLLKLWTDGFTSFSIVPLQIASVWGIGCTFLGFITGIVMIMRKLLYPNIAAGYTSIIATILFCGGLIMLMLGIIGEYIGRIFITINCIPQYVIKESINYKKI